MSVDRLHEAARLMRERAEAATPGAWSYVGSGHGNGSDAYYSSNDRRSTLTVTSTRDKSALPDAAHIASWHPAVALAVADWLEQEASFDECIREYGGRGISPDHPAVAVADAYLGSES